MPESTSVVARALRQIANLERVEQQLNDAPHTLLAAISGSDDGDFETVPIAARAVRPPAERDVEADDELPAAEAQDRLIEAGRRAVAKVRRDGRGARLDRREADGLEAIILLTGRPALLIQNGKFFPPPDDWSELETVRAKIESHFPSIGRIEVTGHPDYEWIGTGFLVADDVVMTNRHVAMEFSREDRKKRKWKFAAGMKPSIDFNEELGATQPVEFALTDVIGIHEKHDMALLRVAKKGSKGRKTPAPLEVDKAGKLKKGRKVYVVGYPASDSRRNDPDVMRRIFSNVYDVKRLQPGELTGVAGAKVELNHDCSTLGGNSGSCVIDLETHKVVGLHFGGRYGVRNYAIMLAKLTKDPLIRKAQINYA
jgi:V8-like Glu-specific endopeptidase